LPILPVLVNNSKLKWLYSSWGTDLFMPKLVGVSNKSLRALLNRVDYLLTENLRVFEIAKNIGFERVFLGVFPGNGGTDFSNVALQP
jgi:hypothetical protein